MELPYVSVIIPVLDAEQKIRRVINGLSHQTYPNHKFEILVVDNGSVDGTEEAVSQYSGIKLLGASGIKNPYFARNKGIAESNGDIIALLDVNCLPNENWLSAGVEDLISQEADLAGGEVRFTFSNKKDLGEWYDSITFVNMEKMIKKDRCCAAGNLFIKREIIQEIGMFPAEERSGGDLRWTKKATEHGFSLIFSKGAYVEYHARGLLALLRKSYRVGTGHPHFWREQHKSILEIVAIIFYNLLPSTAKDLKQKISERGFQEMNNHLLGIWLIDYLNKIFLAFGRLKGLFIVSMNHMSRLKNHEHTEI